MPAERTCTECGTALPANAPGNRCPKCLLEFALGDSGQIDFPEKTARLPEPGIPTEQVGTMIGRYKLLQEIGEGGFGIVFMAEQQEPVHRKVALKIIKAGMDTREIIARFEAERQALALKDHPNIAQVLDGGTTSNGRPYFVMELVRGIPITQYCDQANLSTRERLELFMKVCRAVQHAHQKGLIHRDLKPSNVLVTLQDSEPLPKIIDFGVAKALGQKLTEKTLFTRFEQMIGTPAYMSPEQAGLGGLDIDTRSDIYSLGVLLYELLTGVTPLDAETLRQGAMDEIRRQIQETDPPKPSTRVATLGQRLAEIAKHRHAEPAALNRLLRGDLDWITMKALEKDRRRRYEIVNGLAADIERYLRDEPVAARPPSALYRIQKVARRHRVAFAASAAVAVTLVLGIVISTWQAVRATRAEREQSRLREEAQKAQANEAMQRQHAQENLIRQYVANGNRLVDDGDLFGALPWFVEALSLDRGNSSKEELHRVRIGSLLRQCPKLAQVWFHNQKVNYASFSPDGRFVATASGEQFDWNYEQENDARIWDAANGQLLLPPLKHKNSVVCVCFSPEGKRVATASWD